MLTLSATPIAGAYVITPRVVRDERGWFVRTMCRETLERAGLCGDFVQANQSQSLRKGTIRGLHYQMPPMAENKLIRCVRGAVQDVVVDVRSGSPTFLHWHSEILTSTAMRYVYVPAGCAHGIQALEDDVSIAYFSTAPYSPENERGIRYSDPRINIRWEVEDVIVSEKDRQIPPVDDSFAGVTL